MQAFLRSALKTLVGIVAVASAASACGAVGMPVRSYTFVRSTAADLVYGDPPYALLQPRSRELWVASDGSGRLVQVFGDPIYFSPRSRAAWGGLYSKPPPIDRAFGPRGLSPTVEVPSSIATFQAVARKLGGDTRTATLRLARSLLAETGPSVALRALVLTVLESSAGVSKESQTLADGRVIDTFSVVAGEPSIRYELILDHDGDLLGDDQVLLTPFPPIDATTPVVIQRAAYSVVVDVATTREPVDGS